MSVHSTACTLPVPNLVKGVGQTQHHCYGTVSLNINTLGCHTGRESVADPEGGIQPCPPSSLAMDFGLQRRNKREILGNIKFPLCRAYPFPPADGLGPLVA